MHLLDASDGTIQLQKRLTDVNIFLFRCVHLTVITFGTVPEL